MPAKTLMIQGTGSSVGKSALAAAICRIFKQEGMKVAPFKAQNMSLNSYATADGGEIGRAQAVQAEAAGVLPTVEMNPVLLKPEADNRCQIIIRGKAATRIAAADFPRLKTQLWKAITESVDHLRNHFDLIIIEGAGSPAEINLRDRDLVNMKVACYCRSPVLLVADIDRGGVFAALVGTMELLEPAERDLVKAFIVNKFRGDVSLLTPGLRWLEERTGVPVAGVIPYFHDIHIAEEDSVTPEIRRTMKHRTDFDLDIAVVALPHIANFDDFDPLARESRVRLRYVEAGDDFGEPDLIILPGTKTTVADLLDLRSTGRDREIIRRVAQGTPIIGICGGYQMLGLTIQDPDGIESMTPMINGLARLPVTSRFTAVKSTHQVRARVAQNRGILAGSEGIEIQGYEIHMGQTGGADVAYPFELIERSSQPCSAPDGCLSADGNVMGTYIHGLFHNARLRHAILSELAARKGRNLSPLAADFSLDEQYNHLASHVRNNVSMDLIRKLIDDG